MNSRLFLDGLEELEITADGRQIDQIAAYVGEIERWNRRTNLVRAGGDLLIIRHILDSLAGLAAIRALRPSSLADVGSGAGLPGIPLAVFLESTEVVLVERSAKRAAFLQNVVALLQLRRCSVSEIEIEREKRYFDVVCCRALGPLNDSFPHLASRLAPGGTVVFYKGKKQAILEELSSFRGEKTGYRAEVVPLKVPFLPEERHLLLFLDTSR